MIYVKVNNQLYPAKIAGKISDSAWDGRDTKEIHLLTVGYAEAVALFEDNTPWAIVQTFEELAGTNPETGEPISAPEPEEWDNSDYCCAGDVTDHRDGTATVKMGRLTEVEQLMAVMV